MNTVLLKAASRQPLGKRDNKRLRKGGLLPSSISVKDKDSIAVTLNTEDFRKALNSFGRSAVFKFEIDKKKKVTAMLKELQTAPLSFDFLSASFVEVSLKEQIKASVAVRVVNTEVLEFNKMIQSLHTDNLTLAGLPQDIPNFIDIDGQMLFEKGNVHVNDLTLPKGIVVEAEAELLVASASALRIKEEPGTEESDEVASEQAPTE